MADDEMEITANLENEVIAAIQTLVSEHGYSEDDIVDLTKNAYEGA